MHNGIIYEFKWAKRQEVIALMPPEMAIKVMQYFNLVLENNIPHELFDDSKVRRCSKFRIKGLERGAQNKIAQILLDGCKIEKFHASLELDENQHSSNFLYQENIHPIFNSIAALINEYERMGVPNYRPSHEEVLTKILLEHEFALSIETPVWTRRQQVMDAFLSPKNECFDCSFSESITGHIDLILYDKREQCLIIADYKPEGFFLRSLPQVAIYGLMVKRTLQMPKIKCMSFNKESAWVYDPAILKDEIDGLLKKWGDPQLFWRKMIRKF